jgi:amidase
MKYFETLFRVNLRIWMLAIAIAWLAPVFATEICLHDTLPVINPNHPNPRMRFKVWTSQFNTINQWLLPFEKNIKALSEDRFNELSSLILGKTIPELQRYRADGLLTYEELTLFFLARISKMETDQDKALHAYIAIHPDCLNWAKACDTGYQSSRGEYTLYGIPIALKDNIQVAGLPTTAGAEVLKDHKVSDAFITKRLKAEGAVIIGKANLSEWAYYFCEGCPVGYSAMGGQTLNPYGRGKIETGGSSSGSASVVAGGLAVAAVGSETSGSILSPSGLQSLVGLKPTAGALSRTGIVPISYTLDTPGPMTGSCIDNAILYNAMLGRDTADPASFDHISVAPEDLLKASLMGKKLGVIRELLADSVYAHNVDLLEAYGAEVVAIDIPNLDFSGLITILNLEMREAIPQYLAAFPSENVTVKDIADIVAYNQQDMMSRAPYGQQRFEILLKDKTPMSDFPGLRTGWLSAAETMFASFWDSGIDAVISLSNYHAAHAAMGRLPCLTVPSGYKSDGTPIGLTFIGPSRSEASLLNMGHAFESRTTYRKLPAGYGRD